MSTERKSLVRALWDRFRERRCGKGAPSSSHAASVAMTLCDRSSVSSAGVNAKQDESMAAMRLQLRLKSVRLSHGDKRTRLSASFCKSPKGEKEKIRERETKK